MIYTTINTLLMYNNYQYQSVIDRSVLQVVFLILVPHA